ncbi:MAG: hypothetical protein JO336_11970 [Acidobacteriia bacterium]|nr:hypothetical protein [Terriglobia bacterium]MBV8903283.1 hypothetical protein [Terriglobia bacterium]MBV9745365.1 hypothetical protein [Terriglobia bacterium]
MDWSTLVIPIAVLGALALFRFVGCTFTPTGIVSQPYADDVLLDNPLVYYRLQETIGSTTATDETGHLNALYGVAPGPLNNADYFSLPISTPSLQLGADSVMQKDQTDLSVRFNGSFVSTQGQGALSALGDLSQFTADILVHPEWDVANERNFYCVLDYSNYVAGIGPPGPNRNAGFAIYAGPDSPSDPTTPICWQLWIGTGNEFLRALPLDGGPGPLVLPEDTYLAVQFGPTQAFLWAYTVNADVDQVKFELEVPPYVQPTDPNPANIPFNIGISQNFAALFSPFPGPNGFIYPFVGRMAEAALYNTVLDGGRLMSHIMNAFNTTS